MSTDERHYLGICVLGVCFWVVIISLLHTVSMPESYCNPNVTNPPMRACMVGEANT